MYRGLHNEVRLTEYGFDAAQHQIEPLENVKLNVKSFGVYTALPQAGQVVKLLVVDAKGKAVDTLVFSVKARPVPVLFLCGVEQGGAIENVCDTLRLAYPAGVNLTLKFTIVKWELTHPNLEHGLSGTTEILEGLDAILPQLSSNSTVEITMMYADEFNVVRKIVARWHIL